MSREQVEFRFELIINDTPRHAYHAKRPSIPEINNPILNIPAVAVECLALKLTRRPKRYETRLTSPFLVESQFQSWRPRSRGQYQMRRLLFRALAIAVHMCATVAYAEYKERVNSEETLLVAVSLLELSGAWCHTNSSWPPLPGFGSSRRDQSHARRPARDNQGICRRGGHGRARAWPVRAVSG